MSQLLTYTEFLNLCGGQPDIRGLSYDEILRAIPLSRRTLYNERSISGWRVKKQICGVPFFEPEDVYEWLTVYSVKRQRLAA